MVILNAVRVLKNIGIKTKVIFTGKEYDYKNKRYFTILKKYIKAINIAEYISFLGFIKREEQIQIMDNSLCIIQPSLFEGWSTVVEDSKALNKYILVSDISIHREQIQKNCTFFDPKDYNDLANKMMQCLKNIDNVVCINYADKIQTFATNIINLLK
jgi:glycosyltransferase involved in cell wall biosynthesis